MDGGPLAATKRASPFMLSDTIIARWEMGGVGCCVGSGRRGQILDISYKCKTNAHRFVVARELKRGVKGNSGVWGPSNREWGVPREEDFRCSSSGWKGGGSGLDTATL